MTTTTTRMTIPDGPEVEEEEEEEEEESSCTCTVILLCGLPASGKSTLSRRIIELSQQSSHPKFENTNVVHMEYDALEDELLLEKDVQEEIIKPSPPPDEENDNQQQQQMNEDDNNDQCTTTEDGNAPPHDDRQQQRRRRIEAWNETRSVALKEVETTIQEWRDNNVNKPAREERSIGREGTTGNSSSLIILMDDNYHLRGMRKQIHRLLLKKYKPIRFGIIWIDESVEVCIKRNRQRVVERKIPEHTIIKMSKSFEPPRSIWESNFIKVVGNSSSSEEYDDAIVVVDDDDDNNNNNAKTKKTKLEEEEGIIVDFITQCPMIIDLPPDTSQQEESDRIKTQSNQRHQFDKLLRSWVGQTAKFDKTLARYANESRKVLIQQIKQQGNNNDDDDDGDGNCHNLFEVHTESQLLDAFVDGIVVAASRSSSTSTSSSSKKNQNNDVKIDPDHISELKSCLFLNNVSLTN